MFPSKNQRFFSSGLIIAMIYACARFCLVMLSGISKEQVKWCLDFDSIVTRRNHSFHHWYVSTMQYLVLLSLRKVLNLSPTSSKRNNVLKLRVEK